MSKYKNFLLTLLVFSILVLATWQSKITYANGDNLSKPWITPESFYYPFKRIYEKALLTLNFSSNSKIEYNRNVYKERLAELNYVANSRLLGVFETSSNRFSAQAGTLTDNVLSLKMDSHKKDIIKLFNESKATLEKMRDLYPANSSYWMLIQHSINSLELNSEKLK